MNFPNLKTARVLSEEEMLRFRGGSCSSICKTGCSPGNKNNGTIGHIVISEGGTKVYN